MADKKKIRATTREAKAARREGKATMSTEPFPPQAAGTDPAEGAASIAPVTPDMMDHAARLAAEKADAVAHEPSSPPVAARESLDEPAPAAEAPPVPESDGWPAPAPAAETVGQAKGAMAPTASANPVAAEPVPAPDAGVSLGLLNAKILEITAANVSASGEFVSALLSARSLPEAAAINADHLRRRLDALATQGRDLLVLTQRVAFDALRSAGGAARRP